MQVSGATTAILSCVIYPAIASGRSNGIFPNADGADFQVFNTPTPNAANTGSLAGALKINEWMAANTTTIADPADGDFEDWVEICNTRDGATPGVFTFIRRKAATFPGISYIVEWNDDLANTAGWSANTSATEATLSLDATWERVQLTDTFTSTQKPKRFARLRVTAL